MSEQEKSLLPLGVHFMQQVVRNPSLATMLDKSIDGLVAIAKASVDGINEVAKASIGGSNEVAKAALSKLPSLSPSIKEESVDEEDVKEPSSSSLNVVPFTKSA